MLFWFAIESDRTDFRISTIVDEGGKYHRNAAKNNSWKILQCVKIKSTKMKCEIYEINANFF